MFRSHITENSTVRLSGTNTDIAVIHGGLTSLPQPLDVSLSKPYEDNVRERNGTTGCSMEKNSSQKAELCMLLHWMFCVSL